MARLITHRQPLHTGFIGQVVGGLAGLLNPFSWFTADPADTSDATAAELAAKAATEKALLEAKQFSEGLTPDEEMQLAFASDPDRLQPQTYAQTAAAHAASKTTRTERCAGDPLCVMGLRNEDGSWPSFGDLPLGVKIVGGVIALGVTLSLVRGVTGLFGGK